MDPKSTVSLPILPIDNRLLGNVFLEASCPSATPPATSQHQTLLSNMQLEATRPHTCNFLSTPRCSIQQASELLHPSSADAKCFQQKSSLNAMTASYSMQLPTLHSPSPHPPSFNILPSVDANLLETASFKKGLSSVSQLPLYTTYPRHTLRLKSSLLAVSINSLSMRIPSNKPSLKLQ